MQNPSNYNGPGRPSTTNQRQPSFVERIGKQSQRKTQNQTKRGTKISSQGQQETSDEQKARSESKETKKKVSNLKNNKNKEIIVGNFGKGEGRAIENQILTRSKGQIEVTSTSQRLNVVQAPLVKDKDDDDDDDETQDDILVKEPRRGVKRKESTSKVSLQDDESAPILKKAKKTGQA